MSRVDRMLAETEIASVAFMTFVRIAAKNRSAIFCFFEGEDEKYYGVRISLCLRDKTWHPINCGGKLAVLELRKEISSRQFYSDVTVAYFVDRDFDEPIQADGNQNIYETPCYSVENLYCDEESIKRILSAEFGMSEHAGTNDCFNSAFETVIRTQNEFHQQIIPLNLFIKAHRLKERIDGNARLNLSNVSIDHVVKIRLDGVTSVAAFECFNRLFPESYPVGDLDITGVPQFDSGKLYYELRGKYELDFIRSVLSKLKQACSSKGHALHRKGYAIKLNLTKGNAISELSQYASTPPCLMSFLGRLATAA